MDAAIRETEEEAGIKAKDIAIDHNFQKVLRVLLLSINNISKQFQRLLF